MSPGQEAVPFDLFRPEDFALLTGDDGTKPPRRGFVETRTDAYIDLGDPSLGLKIRGEALLELKVRAELAVGGGEKWKKVLRDDPQGGTDAAVLKTLARNSSGIMEKKIEAHIGRCARRVQECTKTEPLRRVQAAKQRSQTVVGGLVVEQTDVELTTTIGSEVIKGRFRSLCLEGKKVNKDGWSQIVQMVQTRARGRVVIGGYPQLISDWMKGMHEAKLDRGGPAAADNVALEKAPAAAAGGGCAL